MIADVTCESLPPSREGKVIEIDSDSYEEKESTSFSRKGRLTGQSRSLSPVRPTLSSGKINVNYASQLPSARDPCVLAISAGGLIRLKSLSWMELIRRKHFLEVTK